MSFKNVLRILVAAHLFYYVTNDETTGNRKDVSHGKNIIEVLQKCKDEIEEVMDKIKTFRCLEMYERILRQQKENSEMNISSTEFDSCKALSTCCMKKFEIIAEDGKGISFDKLMEYSKSFENKPEGFLQDMEEKLWPLCSRAEGKDFEIGFNFFQCLITHSPYVKKEFIRYYECFIDC